MIGKTISHYRILSKLGEGGMGVVYKAEDTKLKRTVALKFLPSNLTSDPDAKARFIHEAQAAAVLTHPNICTIHEIDEFEGQSFIAMECFEGETLKDRIARGPLPLAEAIDITREVGQGLSRAHVQSIAHRDIKPANIFLTHDGQVKILDFGLAKLSGQTRLTRTGTTLGTMAYMSPEQARGDGVDQRTDIWSLGVMLYEMLSGQLPFPGDHEQMILYSILNKKVEPLSKSRREVSYALEEIVTKVLTKNPNHRYNQVDELLADLAEEQDRLKLGLKEAPTVKLRRLKRRPRLLVSALVVLLVVAGGTVWKMMHDRESSIDSLVVLPFKDLSNDLSQEYLSEGMTDALIHELSRIGIRRVISRQTAMQYRNSDKTLPEIARELHVDAVVEASVVRSGPQLHVAARLLRAETEESLWDESYDRNLRDVLTLYGDIARAIAREVRLELAPEDEIRLAETRKVDPEAYEAYLRAQHWFWRTEKYKDFQKSAAYFENAVTIDSTFAPAWAGLASVYATMSSRWLNDQEENAEKAREYAERALALDENLAEVHSALADLYLYVDRDWRAAEREIKRAADLSPENETGDVMFLCMAGRFDEAIALCERAQQKDPVAAEPLHSLAMSHVYAQNYHQAVPILENLLELYPDHYWGNFLLGVALIYLGRHEEGLSYYENIGRELDGLDYVAMGKREETRDAIENYKTQMNEVGIEFKSYEVSRLYAGLGETEEALRWLEKATEVAPSDLLWVNTDPQFDYLRSDPRFIACLRRVGFTEEIIEASKRMTREFTLGGI